MEVSQVIQELNVIFRDVLDNDDINLQPETVAQDVEDWDSLNHIQLVVAIEKHYKIRFTAAEIQGWQNVADMIKSIIQKKSN